MEPTEAPCATTASLWRWSCLQELLRQEWGSISQSTVNLLIESMPSRVHDVIQLFGNGSTGLRISLLHMYARTCKLHENASSAFQGYCSLGITFKSKEKPWQQQNSILTLKMTVPVFLSSTVELKRRNSQVHLLLSHASMDFYRNQSLKREKENANTSDQWLWCKGSSSTTGW